MNGRIIPFGYSTPNAQPTLDRLMEDKRAILVDIRYTPYSKKRPEWRQEALEARYGTRYRHVPSLGNVNHANGGEIRLANATQGIPFLVDGLRKGYTLIVMCTCANYSTCHRKTVCELVKAALPEVEVVLDEAAQRDETTLRTQNIPSIPPPELDNAYELTQAIAKAEAAKAKPKVPVDYWTRDGDTQAKIVSSVKSKY